MQPRIARSRTLSRLALWLGAVTLLFGVTPAMAGSRSERSGGALSRTTKAVGAKTSSAPSPSSSSGSNSGSTHTSSSSHHRVDPVYYSPYGTRSCYHCTRPVNGLPPGYSAAPPSVTVKMGLQSVRDSDGAAMATVHLRGNRFGVLASGTHYFEESQALDGSDTVYMNLWTIAVQGRLFQAGSTSLWLQGGLGGTASNNFEPLSGAMLGAEVEHIVNPNLDFYAGARYFVLQESMRASEVRAGIGASFLTVGYRWFAFTDTGEALQGPEVGISVGF